MKLLFSTTFSDFTLDLPWQALKDFLVKLLCTCTLRNKNCYPTMLSKYFLMYRALYDNFCLIKFTGCLIMSNYFQSACCNSFIHHLNFSDFCVVVKWFFFALIKFQLQIILQRMRHQDDFMILSTCLVIFFPAEMLPSGSTGSNSFMTQDFHVYKLSIMIFPENISRNVVL